MANSKMPGVAGLTEASVPRRPLAGLPAPRKETPHQLTPFALRIHFDTSILLQLCHHFGAVGVGRIRGGLWRVLAILVALEYA